MSRSRFTKAEDTIPLHGRSRWTRFHSTGGAIGGKQVMALERHGRSSFGHGIGVIMRSSSRSFELGHLTEKFVATMEAIISSWKRGNNIDGLEPGFHLCTAHKGL